jgi:hypothetical protein
MTAVPARPLFAEQHVSDQKDEDKQQQHGDAEAPHDLTRTNGNVLSRFDPGGTFVNDWRPDIDATYLGWG